MFTTVFVNEGQGKKRVAFAAASPGKIVPVHLRELGGALLAQKDAFLCAAKGVSLGIAFQRRLGAGLFGDRKVDVVTRGNFIEAGSSIKVVDVQGSRIIVDVNEPTPGVT